MADELDPYRKIIDDCDKQIIDLLANRAKAAQEIGRVKQASGSPIYAPDREKKVYDKVEGLNKGPLTNSNIHAIYREIMSACIALEATTRICYFGPAGTFTHQAALKHFGAAMEYRPASTIRDVFLDVSRGHADYGVVPVENSIEGAVSATCDSLMEFDLKVCAEIFLPIHQTLLCNCPLNEITLVVSHPVAIPQCRNWLAAHLPGVPTQEVASTSKAAEFASYKKGVAAIASEAAAALYDFQFIERHIEDTTTNTTRFFIISKSAARSSGDDLTTLLFSVRNEAGSLYNALKVFSENNHNLTRIESRPAKKVSWEYSFFVDVEGHANDPLLSETLEKVKRLTDDFRILGSYPRAKHVVDTPPPLSSGE